MGQKSGVKAKSGKAEAFGNADCRMSNSELRSRIHRDFANGPRELEDTDALQSKDFNRIGLAASLRRAERVRRRR